MNKHSTNFPSVQNERIASQQQKWPIIFFYLKNNFSMPSVWFVFNDFKHVQHHIQLQCEILLVSTVFVFLLVCLVYLPQYGYDLFPCWVYFQTN